MLKKTSIHKQQFPQVSNVVPVSRLPKQRKGADLGVRLVVMFPSQPIGAVADKNLCLLQSHLQIVSIPRAERKPDVSGRVYSVSVTSEINMNNENVQILVIYFTFTM